MVINTNISAQSGARMLSESSNMLAKSLARLSSGSRLVSPEDDAASMAVSMRFDAQINRINAARQNVGNAISFSQTQDGYLKKIAKALDRMSELSVLAQDVTKDATTDLPLYDAEYQELNTYITDIQTKQFNGQALFGGGNKSITTGPEDSDRYDMADTALADFSVAGDLNTAGGALAAQTAVKTMIDNVATDRATIGANVSTLTSYSDQLAVLRDNIAAANSRMKDVDVAEESATFAKYNILVQAGTAMLAQANAAPQGALRLLQ